jgi:excisionase family DNA binding protein
MPRKTKIKPVADDLITTRQVVNELKVNSITIKRAIRNGELKAYRLGNGYKTTRTWLDEWLQSKIVEPVEATK